jgi:RNA polymerase sigma-70 factor (sigma-E family)
VIEGEAPLAQRVDVDRDREVEALFNKHYMPMCRLAFVILGDSYLAEETVMDSLLKTFSGWRRIRDPERAEFYLKRAVVNQCRSKIRRKMVEKRASALMDRSGAISTWDPEHSETRRVVWEAVRKLPERQRACVVLRYYEDLPENEIAEVLDCSVGTVKSQLFKARQKLESFLEAERSGGEG